MRGENECGWRGGHLFLGSVSSPSSVVGGGHVLPAHHSAQQGSFFFFLIFIGVELIYNIVLVSALQQSESVIHIPIATLF